MMTTTTNLIQKISESQELLASTTSIPSQLAFAGNNNTLYCLSAPSLNEKRNALCSITLPNFNETDDVVTVDYALSVVLRHLEESSRQLSKEEILLRERTRQQGSGISSFQIDPTSENILLPAGPNLFIYSIRDKTLVNLYSQQQSNHNASHWSAAKMDAKFSPDGKLVSFIANGDLYVRDLSSGLEKRLTFTSDLEHVSAGVAEFIIQEEFDRYTGYWWSPISSESPNLYRLSYLEVNESKVPTISIPTSGGMDLGADTYRYPRPGQTNATSVLKVVEFNQDLLTDARTMSFDKLLTEQFPWCEYVMRSGWTPDGNNIWLWIIDRSQQHAVLFTMNVLTGEVEIVAEEKSDIWINTKQTIYFLSSHSSKKQQVIFGQETSGFNHLYLYERGDTSGTQRYKLVKAVTEGDGWIVDPNHLWVNEVNGTVYFIGTKHSAIEPHLYSVSLNGSESNSHLTQLTPPGHSVHQVAFNSDYSRFVVIYSSITVQPTMTVFQRSGVSSQYNEMARVSFPFRSAQPSSFELTTPELYSYLNKTGERVYGCIYRPPNYNPANTYPCILYIYGGPHVQLVKNMYSMTTHGRCQLLASLGFIVVVQDGRGSFNRGLSFEGYLRCRMGRVELDDQIDGIMSLASGTNSDHLQVNIDLKRVGIFGWSYGGYMALCALGQRPEFFKVSVAGAPVTMWELYDTGYTERYMDTPLNNPEGYEMGSVLSFANQFPDEDDRLLIIHGLSDENVHFKHVEVLVSAFIKYQKPYQLAVYPGERHGVRSMNAILHWNSRMIQFFMKNL